MFDLLTIRIHLAEAALAVSVVDVEKKEGVDSVFSRGPAFYSKIRRNRVIRRQTRVLPHVVLLIRTSRD